MGMPNSLVITPETICRDKDVEVIRQICEYIITCSVSCNNIDEFLNTIQQLSTSSQAVLMNIIKITNDAIDKETDSERGSFQSDSTFNEENINLRIALKSERDKMTEIQQEFMEEKNKILEEYDDLKNEYERYKSLYDELKDTHDIDIKNIENIEEENKKINKEIVQLKIELNKKDKNLKSKDEIIKELSDELKKSENIDKLLQKYKDKVNELELENKSLKDNKEIVLFYILIG